MAKTKSSFLTPRTSLLLVAIIGLVVVAWTAAELKKRNISYNSGLAANIPTSQNQNSPYVLSPQNSYTISQVRGYESRSKKYYTFPKVNGQMLLSGSFTDRGNKVLVDGRPQTLISENKNQIVVSLNSAQVNDMSNIVVQNPSGTSTTYIIPIVK